MKIRQVQHSDAKELIELYMNHLTNYPPKEEQVEATWIEQINKINTNDNYHLLVGLVDNKIVSSVTLVIIPNLTHNNRPYAVMENVVTHRDYRGQGYSSQLIDHASTLAKEKNCYKIMLMTGSKKESTINFYRKNGFSTNEKTACLKRL